MSIAEMKKQVIEKISSIEDEITIKKIDQLIDSSKPRSIEQIYQKAKAQYGNTLKKLAE